MKKLSIIAIVTAAIFLAQSCSDVKRKPSRVYMPDMAYSRAYETYSDHSKLADSGIFYNARPVAGTIKRGDDVHYELLTDTAGTYNTSSAMKNPLAALNADDAKEAQRLYLVNCGVCHGGKLDGNGPLYKDGNGPFSAKPANLSGSDAKYAEMSEGTMFHSITYGKNMMGSYASQVNPKQRWMIISYIKAKQAASKSAAAAPATAAGAATPAPAAAKDSTAKK